MVVQRSARNASYYCDADDDSNVDALPDDKPSDERNTNGDLTPEIAVQDLPFDVVAEDDHDMTCKL